MGGKIMAHFQEDMIFKDVGEEETDFILKFVNRNSAVKKIWTKELRQLDPSTYRPDFIIELDDENLIIEFQSTDTDDDFSQRALVYVAIANLRKKNDKEVNLAVVSTSEESKVVRYRINKSSIFGYEIIGNNTFDGEKIINEIEDKFERSDEISREETICFSLAPLMTKNGNLEIAMIQAGIDSGR